MENEIVRMEFGSHVYGTSLPTSDRDYKAVFVPDGRDILLGRQTKVSRSTSTKADRGARNTAEDVDVEAFSYAGFLKLLGEGQTVATDMLFVPERHWVGRPDRAWRQIVRCREWLVSKQIAGFVGYCKSQANKYGIRGSRMNAARAIIDLLEPLPPHERLGDHEAALHEFCRDRDHAEMVRITHPTSGEVLTHVSVCNRKQAMTVKVRYALSEYRGLWDKYGERARVAAANEGIDWKALMHAVRIAHQANELLLTGEVTFPRPEAELLLLIRQGELPYSQVAEMIEEGLAQLEVSRAASTLREEPDRALIDHMILDQYGRAIRCS